MSVVAAITTKFDITESITTGVPFADPNTRKVLHNGMDTVLTLNSSSSPPATLVAAFQQALTSGAATMDLTALTGTEGVAVSANGLKVRAYSFRNPATNANPITLTFGASNGNLLLGTGWKVTLQPGQVMEGYLADGGAAVDSTHKTIDMTGTGAQALDVMFLIG